MKGTTANAKELRKLLLDAGYEDFRLPRKNRRLLLQQAGVLTYLQIDNKGGVYNVELVKA